LLHRDLRFFVFVDFCTQSNSSNRHYYSQGVLLFNTRRHHLEFGLGKYGNSRKNMTLKCPSNVQEVCVEQDVNPTESGYIVP